VLGCDTPFPQPGRPCSGYLLQAAGKSVGVDAGSGTLAELQRHADLADIDAIWISHMHPDHWVDLLAAWNAYINDSSLPRPQVFGPPGWTDRLDAAIGQSDASANAFAATELHDRAEFAFGPITLRAYEMHHSVPTFGLRAEHAGRVVAYSADTGPCDALVELGRDAHLLVIETGTADPQEFHCTPEEAADSAISAEHSEWC
jgi:ribonuclease BN (tRNA processing enzyme)